MSLPGDRFGVAEDLDLHELRGSRVRRRSHARRTPRKIRWWCSAPPFFPAIATSAKSIADHRTSRAGR